MVASYLVSLGCFPYSKRTRTSSTTLRSTDSSTRLPKPDEISRPLPLQPRRPAGELPSSAPFHSDIDCGVLLKRLPRTLVNYYRAMPPGRSHQAEGVLKLSKHDDEDNYVFHECGLDECRDVTARPISRFVESFVESDVAVSKTSSLEAEAGSSDNQTIDCNYCVTASNPSVIPNSLPPTITASNPQSPVSHRKTVVHNALVPSLGACTLTATLATHDLSAFPPGGWETGSDDERIPAEYPASPIPLNIHKDLPPLPTPSASSVPPSILLAPSHTHLAQACSPAPTFSRRNADVGSSPLHPVSPVPTNPLLAGDSHLKWSQYGDERRSLASLRVSRPDELDACSTPATPPVPALPSYDTTSRVSCPHPQQDSNGTPPLLTAPIPRVSSFLDLWADTDESLKRHAVTESSNLIECWSEALGNLTASTSNQGGSNVALGQIGGNTFDDGGCERGRDKHNRAHILRIARNIVSAVLQRWSVKSSPRREVEDSTEFDPPSFDVQRSMRGNLHEHHEMGYAEGVGRDLIQGEASLREALDVARNLDLDGDARRSLRGVIAILEEFLTLDATSAGERSPWMSIELRSLSGIGFGTSQISHSSIRGESERDRRKQQLQDATIRVLMQCGEGNEVDEQGVLEAYALIMQEVKSVERR